MQASWAADLAPRFDVQTPPPAWSWTGFYVGATAGANPLDNAQVYFDGGVEAGYNYQLSNIVLGFETEMNFRPLHDDEYAVYRNPFGTVFNNHFTTDTLFINTVRARLGYAVGRFLPYVTGGLAYGDFRSRETGTEISGPPFAGYVWYGDHTWLRTGWTVGGGLEYALTDHVSVKGEYLYYAFETLTLTTALNIDPSRTEAGPTDRGRGHIARLGVNYKF